MENSIYIGKSLLPADKIAMATTFNLAMSAPLTKPHYIDHASPATQTEAIQVDFGIANFGLMNEYIQGEDVVYDTAATSSRVSYTKDYAKGILLNRKYIQRSQVDPTQEAHTRMVDSIVRTHNSLFLKACEAKVFDNTGAVVSGQGVYDDLEVNRSKWFVGTTAVKLDQNYIIELFTKNLAEYKYEPKVLIANPDFSLTLLKNPVFQQTTYVEGKAALISQKLNLWENVTVIEDVNVAPGEFYVVAKSCMKYAFDGSYHFDMDLLPAKYHIVQNVATHSFGFRRNNELGVLKCFYLADTTTSVLKTGLKN